eukprot:6096240-Alexandrium_andersonii.AAC.1
MTPDGDAPVQHLPFKLDFDVTQSLLAITTNAPDVAPVKFCLITTSISSSARFPCHRWVHLRQSLKALLSVQRL